MTRPSLFRPKSIDEFRLAGYLIAAIGLVLLTAFLDLEGKHIAVLRVVLEPTRAALGLVLKAIHVEVQTQGVPLTPLAALVAGVCLFIAPVRNAVGEHAADLALLVLDYAIRLSEWMMRHRNLSAVVLFLLMLAFVDCIYRHIGNARAEEKGIALYDVWLVLVIDATNESTISNADAARFSQSHRFWKERASCASVPDGQLKVGTAVDKLLTETFAQLKVTSNDVCALDGVLRANPTPDETELDDQAKKASAIHRLLRARIHTTIANGRCPELERHIIEGYGDVVKVKEPALLGSTRNISALLLQRAARAWVDGSGERVKSVCQSPKDCVGRSYADFAQPAKDCSDYQELKRRNNFVHLLIGLASSSPPATNSGWFKSDSELADELRQHLETLGECAGRLGLLGSNIAYQTMMQGYATLALLPGAQGEDTKKSAAYLEFALLNSRSRVDSDGFLCTMLKQPSGKDTFSQELSTPFGLGSMVEVLVRECR